MANAKDSQNLKENSAQGKIFQDSVHGTIRLHPLLVKIIDTPQFQRLRNIKQMGGAYFVFPGACHNRFEHSIGTAYLAGKVARILQKQKKPPIRTDKEELITITNRDVLCVEIAGLCHDLGHGPFSHMFDGMFAKEMEKLGKWKKPKKHEEMSCEILDHLIDENADVKVKFQAEAFEEEDREEEMEEIRLNEDDLKFIREMIWPQKPISDKDQSPYSTRWEKKSFLYEIVSNERNKVDVDKWDYFARDCHHLGMKSSFDHERFMQCLQVRKDENGTNQICARDKECYNLHELFHVRFTLHQRTCKHRVVNAVERMICDAFVEEVISETDVGKKLIACMDVKAIKTYAELDDSIFQTILHGKGAGSAILHRILKRDLYAYLGTIGEVEGSRTAKNFPEGLGKRLRENLPDLHGDLVLVEVRRGYGTDSGNPAEKFLFYSKDEKSKGAYELSQEGFAYDSPSTEVQIFLKSCSETQKKTIIKAIEEFCRGTRDLKLKMTPMKKRASSKEIEPGPAKKKLAMQPSDQ